MQKTEIMVFILLFYYTLGSKSYIQLLWSYLVVLLYFKNK